MRAQVTDSLWTTRTRPSGRPRRPPRPLLFPPRAALRPCPVPALPLPVPAAVPACVPPCPGPAEGFFRRLCRNRSSRTGRYVCMFASEAPEGGRHGVPRLPLTGAGREVSRYSAAHPGSARAVPPYGRFRGMRAGRGELITIDQWGVAQPLINSWKSGEDSPKRALPTAGQIGQQAPGAAVSEGASGGIPGAFRSARRPAPTCEYLVTKDVRSTTRCRLSSPEICPDLRKRHSEEGSPVLPWIATEGVPDT